MDEDDYREAMEVHAAMQRINRIARRTIICAVVLLIAAILYGLFG